MGKSADYFLLAPLASLPAYQDLLNRLQEGDYTGGSLRGLGLPRAVRLAVLAALHHDLDKPILLLTNRADRALSLFDELGFWLPEGINLTLLNRTLPFTKICLGRKAHAMTVCGYWRSSAATGCRAVLPPRLILS